MGYVTREQIEKAKAVSIEDYILSHEPNNIKRVGHTLYLKDHDSLRISNGLWKWESRGIGGKNVVDYLIKVRGFEFTDAVRHLAGDEITPIRTVTPKARPPTSSSRTSLHSEPAKADSSSASSLLLPPRGKPRGNPNYLTAEREPLKLPRRNDNNTRVIEYLQNRGINEKLIQECIRQNILYESADFHNAVFVGRDEYGKARFAAMRGTIGTFKRDADGSDKSYGFCLPPNERDCKSVIIFESPIDAISHKMLCPEVDGYRLSLGGTALAALTRFLETHSLFENITVCTDNDTAGNLAAQKIAELPGCHVMRELPPNGAKDWNDALISNRKEVNILEDKRKDILFLSEPFTYPEAFRIKDGESVKVTFAYDGEVKVQKCRFIDEAHLTVGSSTYHISELAEMLAKNGNKVEPIPNQKPMLNILAAKYGEPLKDVEIPMTKAAVVRLVGGAFTTEDVRGDHIMLRGKDGVAVCKSEGDTLAPVHPYWAQTIKHELGTIAAPTPEKTDFLGKIDKLKDKAAAQSVQSTPDKSRKDTSL